MSNKTNTPSEAYTMTAPPERQSSKNMGPKIRSEAYTKMASFLRPKKQKLSWGNTRARSPNGVNSMATTTFFILTRHGGEVKEN